jgi:hypothetical protein
MRKTERIHTGNVNIDTTKPISLEQFKILQNGRDAGKTIEHKKAVQHIESDLQQSCIKWFAYQYPQYWLFSVKNSSKMGGKKVKGKNGKEIPLEAIIAKREGLRKGVADLQLLYGNGEHFSLFLELKTDTGSQSKEQKEFEAYCTQNKFKYVVIRSIDQFIQEIKEYIHTVPQQIENKPKVQIK